MKKTHTQTHLSELQERNRAADLRLREGVALDINITNTPCSRALTIDTSTSTPNTSPAPAPLSGRGGVENPGDQLLLVAPVRLAPAEGAVYRAGCCRVGRWMDSIDSS